MKTIILYLSLAVAVLAQPARIVDEANLLGSRSAELAQSLPSDVWIHTVQASDNITIQGDREAADLPAKSFLIFVAVHPHGYRISMNPRAYVDGALTVSIGRTMADRFRSGDFYDGLKSAAYSLDHLLIQQQVTTMQTTTTSHAKESNMAWWWIAGCVGVGLIGAIICLILLARSKRLAQEAKDSREELRRERSRTVPSAAGSIPRTANMDYVSGIPATDRRMIVEHYGYPYGSYSSDQQFFNFLLMMNLLDRPMGYSYPGYYPESRGYSSSVSDTGTTETTTRSESRADSSSSYDAGGSTGSLGSSSSSSDSSSSSSGSDFSGGSSFDSGSSSSSSDSGGSGGSW